MSKVLKWFRNWGRNEDGSMAIEFVLMVPLFVAMISGVVDLSRLHVDQANYYNVARDTARIVARHGMDVETAEEYVIARVAELSQAEAEVEIATTAENVTIQITAPVEVLGKFDFLDFLHGMEITATVTHAFEPT